MGDIATTFAKESLKPGSGIPDYGLAAQSFTRSYLLFRDLCERRVELAERLARAYHKRFPGEAVVSVRPEPVPPSDETARLKFFAGKPKFLRRQCIVEIDEISDEREPDGYDPNSETIVEFMLKYAVEHFPHISLFSSVRNHRDRLYLQFDQSCDRRLGMAREMVRAYMGGRPGKGRYRVNEKPVAPGPETIDSRGNSWIDGFDDAPSNPGWRQRSLPGTGRQ